MTALWIILGLLLAVPVVYVLSLGLLDARQYRWRRR